MELRKWLYNRNLKIFLKNIILLESNPDFADNTKAVYDELINRRINDKYRLIWFIDDKNKFKDIKNKNVKFIQRDDKFLSKIICLYYNIFSKYIIDCNKVINKYNKHQFRIHLTHGAPLKIARDYCRSVGEIDYVIQISDFFTNITKDLFNVDEDKILTLGFPRCDEIYKDVKFDVFPEIKRNKTIVWFPTYRNHKNFINKDNKTYNMGIKFPFGVPCINSDSELNELNRLLNNKNILLLIKLHPVEDDTKINELKLSNIKLIKDIIFEKKHNNLYQMFSNIDALITDYSSVYYDFLLTKKPIGLAISDIKEYTKYVELLFKDYEKNIAGEYIYNFNDLKRFIENIAENKDIKYEDRLKKLKLYQKYDDGQSSKRVVNILVKKMEEKEKSEK